MSKEPVSLRRGKVFHREVQSDWKLTAQGTISSEKAIRKPNGRKGRIDVHALDDETIMSAVLEAKATNWDVMTDQAVRRNVRRHVRQVWDYIEAELADGVEVSPGLTYSQMPKDPAKVELIEEICFANGIAVVWHDEPLEECKERHLPKHIDP